jgi:hypothetical protein
MEEAVGGGSGSFDGAAGFLPTKGSRLRRPLVGIRPGRPVFEQFVEHGVAGGVVGEFSFYVAAAAEAPGGSGDLGDEGFFEEAGGVELVIHGFAEFLVEIALFGFDVVGSCVKAHRQGVTGGCGFAGFGEGSGGVGCVLTVGVESGIGSHLGVLFARRLARGKGVGLEQR